MSTTSGGDTTAHKMQDSSVTTVYNGDRTVTGQRISPPSSSNGDSGLDNSHTESSAGDAKLIVDVPDFSNEMETSRTGIDNPSFETDKTDVTKSLTNGHNGTVIQENGRHEKDKMAEAVNLELINMKPFAKSMNGKENGVPTKKKETAVNMNDTYDDYFIPVNEHKKYIRGGEKLYVTKDKRDLNQSKKPFMCWVFGLVLLAAAVIVAILASTGIIFSNETAIESRNFMENEKIAGFGNHHVQYSSSVTPPPSSVYSSSPFSPPTTDMSEVFVPRTVQGELAIDNLDFTPSLGNKSSSEFEELAHSIESELKNALFTSNSASDAIRVKVIEFSSGSIIAKYRIGWDYKDDSEPQDVIDAETLKSRLDNYLQENHGHLYNYRVPIHRLRSEPITDKCKTENGKCSHYCSYDYSRLDFVCSCPSELSLSKNLKDCRRIDDNTDDMDDFVFSNHDNDQKPNDEDTFLELEPSTDPEGKSESESEVPEDFEPKIEPEGKTEPEPSSIPEDNTASEPSSIPEDNAEPEPKSEPGAKAEPEPSSIPEPSAEPEPSIVPETIAEPGPNSELSAKAEPEPSSIPEASAEPEPSIAPETHVEPEPSVKAESEPSSIPESSAEPEHSIETKAEPEPSVEPNSKVEPEPNTKTEPEPSLEPGVKSEPEPGAKVESSITPETKAEPEPSSEPNSKAEPEPSSEPNSKAEPEPSSEPNSKAEPEPSSEPNSKVEPEPSSTPEVSAEPEPSVASNVKAEPEPSSVPVVKVEPEPSSDHGAKTEPEPSSKPEIKTELESVVKTESNSNPEPEPSAEPNSNSSPREDYKSLSDVDISSDFISAEQDVKPFKSSTEKSISIMDQSDREAKSHSDDIFNQEIKPEVTYSVSTESEFETKTESVSDENSKSKEEHSFSLGDIISNDSEESTLPTITENWLSTLSINQGIPKLPNDLEVSNKENDAVEEEIKTESSFIAGQIESKPENKSTTDMITETQSEQLTELPDKFISDNTKDISDMVTASTIDTSSTTREDMSLSSNEFENINKEHVTEMIDITTIMPSILEQVSTKSTVDLNPPEIEHSDDLSSFEKTNIPEPTKKLQSLTSLEEQITNLPPVNIISTSTQSVENLNENSSGEEQDSLDNIMTQQIDEQNIADTVNEDEQTSALDFHQKPELKKKEKKTSKNPDIYLSDTGFTKRNKTKTEKEKENKKNNKSDNMESMSEIFSMSKCEEGLFQCLNGTTKDGSYCIPMLLKCNTNKDCTDNSDEYDCFENACSGNFQCKSGECLQRNLVCNNIIDCEDGSDEQSCDLWKCSDDEKQCNGGQCLPSFNFCDGKSHCNDHSDELQCNSTCNGFQCSNGYCISSTLRCNGVNDCTGSEDEQNCDCNGDEFKCNTSSECIPKTQVCDNIAQCTDRSDEWQCIQLDGTQLLAKKEGEIAMKVCSTNWSDHWSNFVCQSLGFTETKTTNFRTSESAEFPVSYLKLKDDSTLINSKSLIGYLESSTTSCDTIEIKCSSKHLCGDFGGKDPLSMDIWPSVIYLYNTKTQKSCTSSLVKRNWLLSSYSCLKTIDESLSPDQWEAISSKTRVAIESNLIKKSVSRIISHPGLKYEKLRYLNDTVLVELSTPYDLSDEVNTICLPEKVVDNKQPCVTASWSYESPGVFKQFSRILSDPLMQTDACNSTKQFNGFLTEREICVASGEMEANNMEIGSPLMCLAENGLWQLQGMLSYHGGYGRSSKPSLYNPVVDAVPWAENTIAAGV